MGIITRMKFKIGFDAHRLFHNNTGLGNYSRTLVSSLRTMCPELEIHLFCAKPKENSFNSEFFDGQKYILHHCTHGITISWRHFEIPKLIEKYQLDIYHGLSAEIPKAILQTNVKKVVTIHDIIFLEFPQQYPWIDRQFYNIKSKKACEYADKIVAISEATKEAILQYYPETKSSKIEVIYQSCHPRFWQAISQKEMDELRTKFKLPERFFLYVGSIIERKNLLNLVKAIHLMDEKDRIPLVVLGTGKTYLAEIKSYIKSENLKPWFVFFEAFPYEKLPVLYKSSVASIYPSLSEGFGIPVLESLCTGTLTITHKHSSLKEAGGEGACLVDCANPQEIRDALIKALNDQSWREEYLKKIPKHLQKFKLENATNQYLSLYSNLLK